MRERWERGLWYAFVFLLPFQTVWIVREIFISGEKWQYGTIAIFASEIVLFVWFLFFLPLFPCLRGSVESARRRGGRGEVPSLRGGGRKAKPLCFLPCKGEVPSLRGGGRKAEPLCFLPCKGEVPSLRGGGVSRLLRKNTHKIIAFFFLVWIFLSVLWAHDQSLAFANACVFLLGAGLFWVSQKMSFSARTTAIVFVCALFVHAGIGIGQFVWQESFSSNVLGMSAHVPADHGASVLKMASGRILRAYGGMAHPNVLGGALSVGLILLLWLWITARCATERVVFPIVFEGLLFALVLTFSRTAWAGFFFGCVFFFGWMVARKKTWNGRTIPIGLILLATILVFGFALRGTVAQRFSGDVIAVEGSVRDRAQLARDAFSVWKERPIAGVGLGNETLAVMERDFGADAKNRADVPVWEYQPTHNVFLLALAETGLVGFALFLGMTGFLVLRIARVWKERSMRRIAFAAALLALAPVAFLDHWLWTSSFGILLLALLVGLLIREGVQEKKTIPFK